MVALITQARMGSTRLPGKVLKAVLGKPLLAFHLERLKRVKKADHLIVATTKHKEDDDIESLCLQMGVSCFRGSEEDVLDRYLKAAERTQCRYVVRCTADCPLIDPVVVDEVIAYFLAHQAKYAYVSNTLERTFPRGMDVEIFPFSELKKIARDAKTSYDREHVTAYFWRHPELYQLGCVRSPVDLSEYRLTVDTWEDFLLIEKILEALYPENPHFTLRDIVQVLEEHPSWVAINAHIEQK